MATMAMIMIDDFDAMIQALEALRIMLASSMDHTASHELMTELEVRSDVLGIIYNEINGMIQRVFLDKL